MSEIFSVIVKPVERSIGRGIYMRTHRGETYYSLEEALEILIQFTAALERAADPTPIVSTYVPAAPYRSASPSPRPQRGPVNLEDLA
jgi:hypothetical protein